MPDTNETNKELTKELSKELVKGNQQNEGCKFRMNVSAKYSSVVTP